jgi:hypothetical protein
VAYLPTADVLKFSLGAPAVGIVSNVLNDAPLLRKLAARARAGYVFTFPRKTADPAVGFRAAYDGRLAVAATYEQVTVTSSILDASCKVDVAVAQADELGEDHAISVACMDHLQAALFKGEGQILNGGADGFDGFADLTQLDGTASSMVVDAGGSTALGASSVYLIRSIGDGSCEVIWSANGEIKLGERTVIEADGSATGFYPAYYTPITAWMGLQVATDYDVARIANLTAQSNKGLTDDLIAEAIGLFPASRKPNLIAMSRRSLSQLQQSRTSYSPTGAPAQFPTDAFGIEIVVTDALSDKEAILGATG